MAEAPAVAPLALYYDRLSRYLRWAAKAGRGHGTEGLTMHRALAPPGSAEPPHPDRIHDLIIDRWAAPVAPLVLDAGCGLGGTVFRWQQRLGGRYLGLTVSALQRDRATAEAERRGIGDACRFECRSYDQPPAGPYDAIVAIESLAHSGDPAASIAILARALAPAGAFIIVDDMPESGVADDRDFETFRAGWHCPALANHISVRGALSAAGLSISTDDDLTAWVRSRSATSIAALAGVNRICRTLIPSAAARMVLDSHHGGLALERLYRRGLMRYRLIIGRAASP